MLSNQQPCTWLARKFLLFSLGVYVTIVTIMAISSITAKMGICGLVSSFIAFLITIFARTFYEQIVIADVPYKYVTLSKNALFALIYAIIMSIIYYYVRTPLGYLGIPLAIVIAQATIKPVKRWLWSAKPKTGLYELYARKQSNYMTSLYGFYGLLAAIAIFGVKDLHLQFIVAFGAAVLIALIAIIYVEWHIIYEQKFSARALIALTGIACILAGGTMTIMAGLIEGCGLPGQAITIFCSVAVKIVEQQLLSRWLCMHQPCTLCTK